MDGRGREGDGGGRRRRSSARRPGTRPSSAAAYAARAGLTRASCSARRARSLPRSSRSRARSAREVREVARELRRGDAQLPRRSPRRARTSLVNSLNPNRIEGQKTAAFEIDEQLGGRAPDVLALPYGGGGNTVAYAKGFAEDGVQPRMISAHAVERATTMASAIRIAEPAHIARGRGARRRGPRRAGRGRRRGHHANVARARKAGRDLLRAVLRGRPRRARAARARARRTVVCVLTGHGLKDTAAVELHTPEAVPSSRRRVDPERGVL